MNEEGVLTEAGKIVSERETPRQRAVRLLRQLLPTFNSRDHALDNLYYRDPTYTPELRLTTIAAALYILGTDDK